MTEPRALLADLLIRPDRATALDEAGWGQLVPVARQSGLLARLAAELERAGVLETVPAAPRRHLDAAILIASKHRYDVEREIACLADALAGIDAPAVLLKGAAYVAAGLPPARGRLFTDIDVMVPRKVLPAVESAVLRAGWLAAGKDSYDEAYYRRWMHQIPPLRHLRRGTVLDIHHTLAPPTARMPVDADPVFAEARPLRGCRLLVPAPEDMVLHSAAHLFNGGEFDNALRDLSDLDLLLRLYGPLPHWWRRLVERARTLGLSRPLAHALTHCRRVFATPVPDAVHAEAAEAAGGHAAVLDWAFDRALQPDHDAARPRLSGVVRQALYLRGHWHRMPLGLLVPHLLRKTWRQVRGEAEAGG